ncbi:MAG TPA: YetF domain-containing protein [Terriglobia bacterium]|nr:YetF domain-containing protein [Terriglobia bacterium]
MHIHIWTDMFVPGLPILDKVLRAVTVYLFLVVALKLAGRRELAQLNAFDLVVLLTISNTVQNAIIGNDSSVTGGLIGASALLVADYLAVRIYFEYSRRRRRTRNIGVTLIENGNIRPDALRKVLITEDELEAAAARQGIASLTEIKRATLNPDGSFAFVREKEQGEAGEYREILRRIDHLAEQISRTRPHEASPER